MIRLATVVLVVTLVAGGPVRAETEIPSERAEELAREGFEKLMRALDSLLRSVPQYGLPRLDEEGNIVIPRRRAPAEPGAREPEAGPEGVIRTGSGPAARGGCGSAGLRTPCPPADRGPTDLPQRGPRAS